MHERIRDLLWFILGEDQAVSWRTTHLAGDHALCPQVPHAEHLAAQKEREIRSLYSEALRACRDVDPHGQPSIEEPTEFVHACFVGILNQWLATEDESSLERTTADLIEAAQALAGRLLPHCEP